MGSELMTNKTTDQRAEQHDNWFQGAITLNFKAKVLSKVEK